MATILGTARPWDFAAIAADADTPNTQVGYNTNNTDGSNAGGTGSQNQGYAYGQQHVSPAGETSPHTVAVTPEDFVFVQYNSGTVNAGAGAYGPFGDTTPTIDYTDAAGYVYPTNCMPSTKNVHGITPTIGKGGLCGVFTDSSGDIIDNTFWFFTNQQWSVTAAAAHSGANTTYTGTFPLGLTAGITITISGFANANNNGTFTCVSNTATSLVLNNGAGVAQSGQTATATSSNIPRILFVPTGAAFLSLGINDSILRDNTGSFDVTVTSLDVGSFAQHGDRPLFKRYPIGLACCGNLGDVMQELVYLMQYFTPLSTPGELLKSYVGQLFPHGAQNFGGAMPGSNGQNFPY